MGDEENDEPDSKYISSYQKLGLNGNPFLSNQTHHIDTFFIDRGRYVRQIHQVITQSFENPRTQSFLIYGEEGFGKTWIIEKVRQIESSSIENNLRKKIVHFEISIPRNQKDSLLIYLDKFFSSLVSIVESDLLMDRRESETTTYESKVKSFIKGLLKKIGKNEESQDRILTKISEQTNMGLKVSLLNLIEAKYEKSIQKEFQITAEKSDRYKIIIAELLEEIKNKGLVLLVLHDDADYLIMKSNENVRNWIVTDLKQFPITFLFTFTKKPNVEDILPIPRIGYLELDALTDEGFIEQIVLSRLEYYRQPGLIDYHPFSSNQMNLLINSSLGVPLYLDYLGSQIIELACDSEEKLISDETMKKGISEGWIRIFQSFGDRITDVIFEFIKTDGLITPYELIKPLQIQRVTIENYIKSLERRMVLLSRNIRKQIEYIQVKDGNEIKESVFAETAFMLNPSIPPIEPKIFEREIK